MKSRAQQIGAKLEVLSSSGQGTRIILNFPEAKEVHAVE
jgi:signal transduction histidine kinase